MRRLRFGRGNTLLHGVGGVRWSSGREASLSSGIRAELGEVGIFGELVQENDEHTLEVAALAMEEPGKEWQGQQQEPKPWPSGADEAEQEQFQTGQAAEHYFGLERPAQAQPTADEMPALGMIFGHGCKLQLIPAAAEDLDVVIAPANV